MNNCIRCYTHSNNDNYYLLGIITDIAGVMVVSSIFPLHYVNLTNLRLNLSFWYRIQHPSSSKNTLQPFREKNSPYALRMVLYNIILALLLFLALNSLFLAYVCVWLNSWQDTNSLQNKAKLLIYQHLYVSFVEC